MLAFGTIHEKPNTAHHANYGLVFGNIESNVLPPRKVMGKGQRYWCLHFVGEWRETRYINVSSIKPHRAFSMAVVVYETKWVYPECFVSLCKVCDMEMNVQ